MRLLLLILYLHYGLIVVWVLLLLPAFARYITTLVDTIYTL